MSGTREHVLTRTIFTINHDGLSDNGEFRVNEGCALRVISERQKRLATAAY
jgi:hypothetical protein